MFGSTRGVRTRLAALVAAPLLLLALAACTATTTDDTAKVQSANGSGVTDAYLKWELDFAQCLRDNGVDVADPDPVKGLLKQPVHDDAYKAAATTCEQQIGGPPKTAKGFTDKELYEASLKYAHCMRDNGVEIEDPVRGEAIIMPEGEIPQEALDACG